MVIPGRRRARRGEAATWHAELTTAADDESFSASRSCSRTIVCRVKRSQNVGQVDATDLGGNIDTSARSPPRARDCSGVTRKILSSDVGTRPTYEARSGFIATPDTQSDANCELSYTHEYSAATAAGSITASRVRGFAHDMQI